MVPAAVLLDEPDVQPASVITAARTTPANAAARTCVERIGDLPCSVPPRSRCRVPSDCQDGAAGSGGCTATDHDWATAAPGLQHCLGVSSATPGQRYRRA